MASGYGGWIQEPSPEFVDLPTKSDLWPKIKELLSNPLMTPPPGMIPVEEQPPMEDTTTTTTTSEAAADGEEKSAATVAPKEKEKDHIIPRRSFPLVYAIRALDALFNEKRERIKAEKKKKEGTAESGDDKKEPEEKPIRVIDVCASLVHIVDNVLTEEEANLFIPNMFKLALQIETLFPEGRLPNLYCQLDGTVKLSRQQVACLLSHAFFGTFMDNDYVFEFQFLRLAAGEPRYGFGIFHGIIRYFLHVFNAEAAGKPLTGNVRIIRTHLSQDRPLIGRKSWASLIGGMAEKPLCEVVLDNETKIEDFPGMLQADFANMHLGGGVLEIGCVQEEIRFGIASPELIVGMLVAHDPMADNEAIVLHGTELVSKYKGYGRGVEWDCPYGDATPRTEDGSIDNYVIAIDALMNPSGQFERNYIDRDLCKAYVGFSYPYPADHFLHGLAKKDVSTGKWGCGVFGGDLEMKFLEQWIAVSAGEPGRKMVFCTFHDKENAVNIIKEIIEVCKNGAGEKCAPIKTVKELYNAMVQYAKARNKLEDEYRRQCMEWNKVSSALSRDYQKKAMAAEEAGQDPPPLPTMPERPEKPKFSFVTFLKNGGSGDQCIIC